jgi:hypothetical protein
MRKKDKITHEKEINFFRDHTALQEDLRSLEAWASMGHGVQRD